MDHPPLNASGPQSKSHTTLDKASGLDAARRIGDVDGFVRCERRAIAPDASSARRLEMAGCHLLRGDGLGGRALLSSGLAKPQ